MKLKTRKGASAFEVSGFGTSLPYNVAEVEVDLHRMVYSVSKYSGDRPGWSFAYKIDRLCSIEPISGQLCQEIHLDV